MDSTVEAVLASWSFPPCVTALNLLAALLYIRGWRGLHGIASGRLSGARLASFLGGLAILQVALASPIDAFAPFLLTDHMFQHMLLMMAVPPLILMGDPVIPMLYALPRRARRQIIARVFRWRVTRFLARFITHPPIALLLFAIVMIGWHLPGPYDLALRSPNWHDLEHASFLIVSLLFWWPVIQPWPSRTPWSRWAIPIYLLLADFVNSALSAFLIFSDRVFYSSYLLVPRLAGISAGNDQAAAGALMWVIGSLTFLIPAVLITVRQLSPVPSKSFSRARATASNGRFASIVLVALTFLLPLAALTYGLFTPDRIDIDGDRVRVQDVSGRFRIAVFTPQDPVSAGDVEVAVLVQDRETSTPILDSSVHLALRHSIENGVIDPILASASRNLAANKLLAATSVNLPRPGTWDLQVSVRRGADTGSVATKLEIQPASER